jgi:hypothetical protein
VQKVTAARSLTDFFAQRVQDTFEDLNLPDPGAREYLTALLARFAGADAPIRALGGGRRHGISDVLLDIQRAWQLDGPGFDPAREVELRRDLGDHTLFMAGFFWERVRNASMKAHYLRTGSAAYRFVADYARARELPESRTFAGLAAHFDRYTGALTYLREVYLEAEFAPWPHPAFARVIRWA